jgi:ABC-type transport system involved in cytochrome c biogenesis ATPase subunit
VEDGAAAMELARIVAGIERPKRGRVLLLGESPHRTPELRARMGVTFGASFEGAERGSVRVAWERARAARLAHGAVMSEPMGLLSLERFDVPLEQLSASELTHFELDLALCLEKPHLLWLFESPHLRDQATFDRVLDRLRQRADEGAIVVSTVRTRREAQVWGDELHSHRAGAPESAAVTNLQLIVERPREIAAELQADPAVHTTSLDPTRPTLLFVSGTDDGALRRACVRAVVARRCELSEMVSVPPPSAAVRVQTGAGDAHIKLGEGS